MIDLNRIYALEMMRKRRLRNTIREDISWDILIPDGGATYSMQIQRGNSAPVIIAWGDGDASEIIIWGVRSVAHYYAIGGTYSIVLTGDTYGVSVGTLTADKNMVTVLRNLNGTGLATLQQSFLNTPNATQIATGCRISPTATSMSMAFMGSKVSPIQQTMQLPAALITAYRLFLNNTAITFVPLTFWPTGGFTSTSAIDLRDMFQNCPIVGSVAPSHVLWDSGKTFTVSRYTFHPNNAVAWLNYASSYTDPVSGITYSKIPYAWGGAPD